MQIIEPHTAGLPQDENVVWISLSVTQIMNELATIGYDISRYFVNRILGSLGLRERSFCKDLPMKDVKDRNEQFEKIDAIRKEATNVGLPIISIDTRKKEMMGISHDTSRFDCDNIARVWREHLREQYPDAQTLVILCDGGGSNSSSHRGPR